MAWAHLRVGECCAGPFNDIHQGNNGSKHLDPNTTCTMGISNAFKHDLICLQQQLLSKHATRH